MQQQRVAVIGTYRSGSSIVAGMLHHLGVDMGAPFWGDYFEPADLAQSLRRWWNEPHLEAAESASMRVYLLRQWLESRINHGSPVGAKHPLLCLSAHDLKRGWGPHTKFVWIRRPIQDAIASLHQQQWFGDADRIQRKLFSEAERFFEGVPHLRLEFEDLLRTPRAAVHQLTDYLQLSPSDAQRAAATELVRPTHRNSTISHDRAPGISRPMIVATVLSGNSAGVVREAIQSVVNCVDAIILIDTGISDQTRQVCTEAAGDKLVIREMPWKNDFGHARNQALRFAKELGAEWAITLDTDERLVLADEPAESNALRNLLEKHAEIDVWLAPSSDQSYSKERIIRVSAGCSWRGRVHEALHGVMADARRHLPSIAFDEVRKSDDELKAKFMRDVRLLRQDIREQPESGRSWYYLGQTLANLQQHEGAIAAFDRCTAIGDWSELAAWSCFMAAKSCAELGLFDEAIERCATGLARDAYYPELAWMCGWCHFQQGRFEQAVAWSHMAVSLGCVDGVGGNIKRDGFRDLVAWYEGPFDVLRHAYGRLHNPDESKRALLKFNAARQHRCTHVNTNG